LSPPVRSGGRGPNKPRNRRSASTATMPPNRPKRPVWRRWRMSRPSLRGRLKANAVVLLRLIGSPSTRKDTFRPSWHEPLFSNSHRTRTASLQTRTLAAVPGRRPRPTTVAPGNARQESQIDQIIPMKVKEKNKAPRLSSRPTAWSWRFVHQMV